MSYLWALLVSGHTPYKSQQGFCKWGVTWLNLPSVLLHPDLQQAPAWSPSVLSLDDSSSPDPLSCVWLCDGVYPSHWLVPATSHIRSFAYITFIAQNTKLLLLFPVCRWANWSLECGRGRTNTEPMCSALLSVLSSPDFLGPFPGLAGNLLTPWCSIYLQPPVVLLNSCRPLVSLVEVFKCQLKTGLDVRSMQRPKGNIRHLSLLLSTLSFETRPLHWLNLKVTISDRLICQWAPRFFCSLLPQHGT